LRANLYAKQKQILDSRITGVGLVFNKTDDGIVVNKVLKNSSARENKVMSGDKIVSVNGVDVKNLSVQEIQDIIDKTENDDIKITLKRGEEYSQKELKRREIPVDTMAYKISESNIAEIKLANVLGKNALSDFEKIIKATNNANVIILDLRNNYGGLLSNAVQMADMMLSKKKILDIKSRGKTKYEIFSDEQSIFKEKPIIILVNEKTASAAEILTGALKDNLEVYVVGENTFGKNTIQYIVPMANRTGLVITSDKYILPNGEDISEIGIKPDIKLEKFNDEDYKKTIDKLVEKIMENKK
jgi:carboxyl-terminal processing protease